MDDYKYAIEWFAYGFNNKDEEYIVRFMMYWIAFNWLYNEHNSKYMTEKNKRYVLKETERIKEFCEANMDKLSRYDAFESGDIDIFLEDPICDGVTLRPHRRAFDNLRFGTNPVRITNLLLTIYYVRCNLFHGSKSIYNLRDRGLIKASSIVLEGYLRTLLPSDQLKNRLLKDVDL